MDNDRIDSLIRTANRYRTIHSGLHRLGFSVGFGLAVTVVIASEFARPLGYPAWLMTATNSLLIISWVGIGLMYLKGIIPQRWRNTALRELAAIDDVRVVGPLLEAKLQVMDAATSIAMTEALVRMLPKLRNEDIGILTQPRLHVLHMLMKHSKTHRKHDKPKLTMAVLDLMARLGGPESIPYVQALALREGWEEVPLGKEADKCLIAMRSRLAREETSGNLLRPTDCPQTDALLRPATSERGSSQVLLRSSVEKPDANSDDQKRLIQITS